MDQKVTTSLGSDHLFCSNDSLIRIIDIPQSIACSQQTNPRIEPDRYIYSTPVLDKPWPSLEPKSDKAKANLMARIDVDTSRINADCAMFIQDGLNKIKQCFAGRWSADRDIETSSTGTASSKRKAERSSQQGQKQLVSHGVFIFEIFQLDDNQDIPILSTQEMQATVIHNPLSKQVMIKCTDDSGDNMTHLLPPVSSVCQGSIHEQSVLAFEIAVEQLYPEQTSTAGIGQFDIILMDPPWDNRSVARSKQYETMLDNENNPLTAVAHALPRLLALEGLLAIWITNKASARRHALEIFKDVEIESVEEWIWIKVTGAGEPVYDLNGIYRQPWEICLVGRRGTVVSASKNKVSRRLFAACPDLHSRKPAIGRLLVDHYNVADPCGLRKLEVFARYTSAGWCAWGDEALKFNDEACWTKVKSTGGEGVGV